MSAKHTPGPWTYWPKVAYPLGVVTRDASAGHIATPSDCGECTEANACLIAAAPDMLEALELCVSWQSGAERGRVFDAARAAIRKAKGE
jgi:hypothetical protein